MVTNPLKGQKVYVDANSLIYAIETPQLFPGLRTQFVQTFLQGDLTIATSWITLAEVLVKPLNQGDLKLESYYRRLLSHLLLWR
jgi:predicted nucleic acid-binding protein